jgi:hypothetical protein
MGGGPPLGGGPGGGGPPRGLFGPTNGKKYNLMLTVSARNAFNHANYATPNGDLSSPFFGHSLSLAGFFGPFGTLTTYNRKIDATAVYILSMAPTPPAQLAVFTTPAAG